MDEGVEVVYKLFDVLDDAHCLQLPTETEMVAREGALQGLCATIMTHYSHIANQGPAQCTAAALALAAGALAVAEAGLFQVSLSVDALAQHVLWDGQVCAHAQALRPPPPERITSGTTSARSARRVPCRAMSCRSCSSGGC